jgi:CHAT domain-containing protein
VNQQRHLTDDQIAQYVSESCTPEAQNERVDPHIAACASCRLRVLQLQLGVLETEPVHEKPSPDCPSEEMLLGFAAGVCRPEDAAQIRDHIVDCSYCAPLLKVYLDVEPEPVPQPVPLTRRPNTFFSRFRSVVLVPVRHRMAWAGGLLMTLVVLIAAGPSTINMLQLRTAESLTASAFHDVRPNAMRLTWGPYGELDLQRKGPNRPSPADYPHLASAAQLVSAKLNSSDPRWIRLRGRVKLLLGESDEAKKLLTAALEKGLNDSSTEIDLAVASFQRDIETSGSDADTFPKLGESLELLSKVLREPKLKQEQRTVATFDLAIVYEKMLLWDQAILIWNKYLEMDPAGPWHEEAVRHLNEAKAKTKGNVPKQEGYREPSFFIGHLDETEVQANLEEYLDIALRSWIVDAAGPQGEAASLAVHKLAELMEERHGDSWMKDFLAARRRGDLPALRALSAAITFNKRGQHSEAEQAAGQAAALFHANKNSPGELRMRFEAVYAHQRLLEEKPCLKEAERLDRDLLHIRYPWLQIQIALEHAVCLNFEARVQPATAQIENARKRASDSKFHILSLRVQGLDASIQASNSNCGGAWQQVKAGLEQYWLGPASPSRLHEFYSPVKLCLEKNKMWNAAEALQRRMIVILEKEVDHNDENVVLQVTAHRALEQILNELDEDASAEDQARLALLLLERVDKRVASRYEIPIKLELVDLQLDRGDSEAALATIQDAEQHLPSENNWMLLKFLRVRGDIQLERRQLGDAEKDYEEGIEIAEKGLSGLRREDQRLPWIKEKGDVYRGLVDVFLEQKRDQEALQLWEWYQSRSFATQGGIKEMSLEPRWPEIEEAVLRQPLPPASLTRVVYVSSRNRLHLWIIGDSGMETVSLPEKREELQREILQYIQECSTPQKQDVPLPAPDEDSRKLFATLLQPIMARLQTSSPVVFDLDATMNGLPMEALKSPQGWYFGERYPVVYSPGYVRETDLRKPAPQVPQWGVLLDALGANSESTELAQLFPGLRILQDKAVSAGELSLLLRSSQMFVFVGHGKSGALIQSNRGPLKAEDFQPESLQHLQLAVLAACSSGLASDGPLDTASLVHAFQSGGTPSVIASQWDVDSRATERLMISFHLHLRNGASVARALYEARKEVIREHGHPYYWAGFVLNGRV